MADVSTEPISAREAASLLDAHSLFRKAAGVLTEVNEQGRTRWPDWGWGSKDQVTQLITGQFQRFARYTIFTTQRPVYLVIGFTDLQSTGEAHVTVWVESDPKKHEIRRSIVTQAEAGRLGASWVRRLDSWQGLGGTHRAATLEGPDAMVAWFLERLGELESAGVGPDIAAP